MFKATNQRVLGPGDQDCLTSQFLPCDGAPVAGDFVSGLAPGKMRFARAKFTPCTPVSSLLEALAEAAKCASRGDAVLLSPACSSFDRFRNDQQRGEGFCTAVKSISGGLPGGNPNGDGKLAAMPVAGNAGLETKLNLPSGFLRENRRAKTEQKYLNERTRHRAISK